MASPSLPIPDCNDFFFGRNNKRLLSFMGNQLLWNCLFLTSGTFRQWCLSLRQPTVRRLETDSGSRQNLQFISQIFEILTTDFIAENKRASGGKKKNLQGSSTLVGRSSIRTLYHMYLGAWVCYDTRAVIRERERRRFMGGFNERAISIRVKYLK